MRSTRQLRLDPHHNGNHNRDEGDIVENHRNQPGYPQNNQEQNGEAIGDLQYHRTQLTE